VVSGGAGSGQVVHDLGRHTGQRIRHEPVDVTNRHHLQTALNSHVLVEQAKGILTERHGIDPGQAFTLLRTYARNHNQRLTQLAASVIDGTTTTELFPGAPASTARSVTPTARRAPRRQE
jgi:hypothetical protein